MNEQADNSTKSISDSLPLALVLAELDAAYVEPKQPSKRKRLSLLSLHDDEEIDEERDETTKSSRTLDDSILKASPSSSTAAATTASNDEGSTNNRKDSSPTRNPSSLGIKPEKKNSQNRSLLRSKSTSPVPLKKKKIVQNAAKKLRRKAKNSPAKRRTSVDLTMNSLPSELGSRRRLSLHSINTSGNTLGNTSRINPNSLHSPNGSKGGSPNKITRSPLNSPKTSKWSNQMDMKEIINIIWGSKIINSQSLTQKNIISLIQSSEISKYDRNMFLCNQGDEGDGMYVVLSGKILILRRDSVNSFDLDPTVPQGYRKVAEMHKGGTFGETSLLKNVPRNASACVKTSEATVLFISRNLFQKLKKFGVLDLSSQLHRSHMRSKLYTILQDSPILSELHQDTIYDLVDKGKKTIYNKGKYIFHEGEDGDGVHIILKGKVDIIRMSKEDKLMDIEESKHDKNNSEKRKRISNRKYYNCILLKQLNQGDLFGETSLLTIQSRNATARASLQHGATSLFISTQLYNEIKETSGGALETEIVRAKMDILKSGFLDRTPPFHNLGHRLKTRLIETMRLVKYKYKQYICKQGDTASRMYFIVKGRIQVTMNIHGLQRTTTKHQKNMKHITNLYPNNFFGEIALIRDDCKRTANCICDDPNGTILMCLHKLQFDKLLKEEEDLRKTLENRTELARMGILIEDANVKNEVNDDDIGDHVKIDDIQTAKKAFDNCSNSLQTPSSKRHHSTNSSDNSINNEKEKNLKKLEQLKIEKDVMEEAVSESIMKRKDTALGNNDYNCFKGVSNRLRIVTMARRMPNIMKNITFDDPLIKYNIAKILKNILQKTKKTNEELCFIMCILKETHFFQKYCTQFSPNSVIQLCKCIQYQVIRKSSYLYKLGDRSNNIAIVLSGSLEVRSRLNKSRIGETVINQESQIRKKIITSGNAVGIVTLEGIKIRIDTAIAKTNSELLIINKNDYFNSRNIGYNTSLQKRLQILRQCPIFSKCSDEYLAQLSFLCQEFIYSKGTTIIQSNENLKGLYIVVNGQVSLSMNNVEINHSNERNHPYEKKKQLNKITILTSNAPFGMYGILNPPILERVEGSNPTLSKTLSNITVKALTPKCSILFLPLSEYKYIIDSDKRYDIINNIKNLHLDRIFSFSKLNKSNIQISTQHYVQSNDTKWLEMSRSKRIEVQPPPIVDCVLRNTNKSVIANVVNSLKLDPATRKSPSLSKLSAATALNHTLDKEMNNVELNNCIYDSHTKHFNREHDIGAVRLNKIYQKKRSRRYNLERDKRWLDDSTALNATCAQDPILPFCSSSVNWIGKNSKERNAVEIAAAATMESHHRALSKSNLSRQSPSPHLSSSSQRPIPTLLKKDSNDTHLRLNKKLKNRNEQKLLIKKLLLPPVETPARPSADLPLALPLPSNGITMIQLRVRSYSTVGDNPVESIIVESPIESVNKSNELERLNEQSQQEEIKKDDWDWMNQVAADANYDPQVKRVVHSNYVSSTMVNQSNATTAKTVLEKENDEITKEAIKKKGKMKKNRKISEKMTKTLISKHTGKKVSGHAISQRKHHDGLNSPMGKPPTGIFFPPPKLGANKRAAQLRQLKEQQFMYKRYC